MSESPVPFSPLKTLAWVRVVTVSIVVVLEISGELSPQIPAASALTIQYVIIFITAIMSSCYKITFASSVLRSAVTEILTESALLPTDSCAEERNVLSGDVHETFSCRRDTRT